MKCCLENSRKIYDLIKSARVERVMVHTTQFEWFCSSEESHMQVESEEQHCKAKWGREGEIIETLGRDKNRALACNRLDTGTPLTVAPCGKT